MKKSTFFIPVLLLVFIPFSPVSFALDYTQMGLPEGAIARFGKGLLRVISGTSEKEMQRMPTVMESSMSLTLS